jgi:hypothetical protein
VCVCVCVCVCMCMCVCVCVCVCLYSARQVYESVYIEQGRINALGVCVLS